MSKIKHKHELAGLLVKIKHVKIMEKFLEDLLTPNEWEEIVERWQLVKQLHKGVPQRTIAKNLDVSIGTITRGSRMLRNKRGGFNQAFGLIKKHKL
jgi:Trp operon repressor